MLKAVRALAATLSADDEAVAPAAPVPAEPRRKQRGGKKHRKPAVRPRRRPRPRRRRWRRVLFFVVGLRPGIDLTRPRHGAAAVARRAPAGSSRRSGSGSSRVRLRPTHDEASTGAGWVARAGSGGRRGSPPRAPPRQRLRRRLELGRWRRAAPDTHGCRRPASRLFRDRPRSPTNRLGLSRRRLARWPRPPPPPSPRAALRAESARAVPTTNERSEAAAPASSSGRPPPGPAGGCASTGLGLELRRVGLGFELGEEEAPRRPRPPRLPPPPRPRRGLRRPLRIILRGRHGAGPPTQGRGRGTPCAPPPPPANRPPPIPEDDDDGPSFRGGGHAYEPLLAPSPAPAPPSTDTVAVADGEALKRGEVVEFKLATWGENWTPALSPPKRARVSRSQGGELTLEMDEGSPLEIPQRELRELRRVIADSQDSAALAEPEALEEAQAPPADSVARRTRSRSASDAARRRPSGGRRRRR